MANFASILFTLVLINFADGYTKETFDIVPLRVKRESRTGFTSDEKRIIIDTHNALRREIGATDMAYMKWSDDLERLAQEWADQCIYARNQDRYNTIDTKEFKSIGENVYAVALHDHTHTLNMEDVIKAWYNEKKHYSFDTGYCAKTCEHYTQIVWSETYSVGCGIKSCSNITGFNSAGFLIVCDYGPSGNIRGYQPYRLGGPPCSSCSKLMPHCIDGLCNFKPVPDSSTRPSGTALLCVTLLLTGYSSV